METAAHPAPESAADREDRNAPQPPGQETVATQPSGTNLSPASTKSVPQRLMESTERRTAQAEEQDAAELPRPIAADKPAPANPELFKLPTNPAPSGKKDSPPVYVGGPQDHLQNVASHPIDGIAVGPGMAKKENAGRGVVAKPAVQIPATEVPAEAEKTTMPPAPTQARQQPVKQITQAETAVAQPVSGWENFHLYMRQNARLPDTARNHNVSGNVRLQFNIGPDGKPANVQVLNGLGFGCDEEAMRLIREFSWSPPGREPVVVEIPFVR